MFLACKVEEQPRKLEYVVKVAYSMMNQSKSIDSQSQVGTEACGWAYVEGGEVDREWVWYAMSDQSVAVAEH